MHALAGKTVLVTGGAGFLGAHLCRQLRAAGCRVVATSRQARPRGADGIEWRDPDLADSAATRQLFAELRPELVYHLAGDVSAAPNAERILPVYHSLLTSTLHVLLAALAEGKPRVLLAGSLTEPDDQLGAPVPSSPYSAAKWAASGYGRMFAALYELPTVILRPFMAFGPGQKPDKIIPYAIACCLRGERAKLSSGRQRADWIFVDDVVEGMVLAATAERIEGATLDLGSGRLASTREVIEAIVDFTRCRIAPEFGALPDRPLERERVADVVATQAKLGWLPRTALREGLQRTVEHARAALAAGAG